MNFKGRSSSTSSTTFTVDKNYWSRLNEYIDDTWVKPNKNNSDKMCIRCMVNEVKPELDPFCSAECKYADIEVE